MGPLTELVIQKRGYVVVAVPFLLAPGGFDDAAPVVCIVEDLTIGISHPEHPAEGVEDVVGGEFLPLHRGRMGLDCFLLPYSLAEWIAENVQKSILTPETPLRDPFSGTTILISLEHIRQ